MDLLAIEADVLELPIPFLLSQSTLHQLRAEINFADRKLTVFQKNMIPMRQSSSGHLTFQWIAENVDSESITQQTTLYKIFASEEEDTEWISTPVLKKLHVQFGHSDFSSLKRFTDLAGKKFEREELEKLIQNCNRQMSSGPGEKPVINRYIIEYPGQTIVIDGFFPVSPGAQSNPAMICVDDYSKFAMAKCVPNLKPQSFIDVLFSIWIPLLGYPVYILCDNSTSFKGLERESVCDAFDMCLILAPTQAHHQVGLAERNVGLIRQAFASLSRSNSGGWGG